MEKSHVIKIGDSGLSRDLYKDAYIELFSGKRSVPVRWMAVESLKDNQYTTASDAVRILSMIIIQFSNQYFIILH